MTKVFDSKPASAHQEFPVLKMERRLPAFEFSVPHVGNLPKCWARFHRQGEGKVKFKKTAGGLNLSAGKNSGASPVSVV